MTEAVQVAFIVSVAPVVAAITAAVFSFKNGQKLNRLSIEIDGRLTELLSVSKRADHAEGVAQERKEERERQDNHAER